MTIPERGTHHLLLVWMIFSGLLLFGLLVSWLEGGLEPVYTTDQSRICWVITALFAVVMIHVAYRVLHISEQIDAARHVEVLLRDGAKRGIRIDNGCIRVGTEGKLPECVLTAYFRDLATHATGDPRQADIATSADSELIEFYRHGLTKPHEFGWFLSDIMIKLGLLGTIVGFVFMLSSVLDITEFDPKAMQGVMKNMSYGMGTALYTTFAGLVACIVTNVQYHFLDQSAEGLIEKARYLAQTVFLPGLRRAALMPQAVTTPAGAP